MRKDGRIISIDLTTDPIGASSAPGDLLRFSDVTMELSTRQVWRRDRLIRLTPTEFSLLELFLRRPGQTLPRGLLMEEVWGYDPGPASRTAHVYVGYLRNKLEAGGWPRLIHTVRGAGYVLMER